MIVSSEWERWKGIRYLFRVYGYISRIWLNETYFSDLNVMPTNRQLPSLLLPSPQ